MTDEAELVEETAEDLFESAPCGYLTTALDGTLLRVNRTFESWTGFARDDLLGKRRFQDLLSVGSRMYYETHFAPLLQMQDSVSEIAMEIVRADGSRLPALVNSVLRRDARDRPGAIRTTVFDATDRRRYERELLEARKREHEIARRLQRSLLASELPAAPGLEIHAAYRPAVAGLDVGGDWYDAFWLGDGARVGLSVGDVVGRGIEAAATMGQLRSAIRALAAVDLPPGQLVERLDEYAERYGVGHVSTLVYARLDLETGELRFTCAGHPPPLIVPAEGDPRFAWEGRSAPLAVRSGSGARPESAMTLPADSVVVLYTDGVVERRSAPLDEGLERLRAEVERHRDATAAAICGALMRASIQPDHADDMCLLVTRYGRRAGPPTGDRQDVAGLDRPAGGS